MYSRSARNTRRSISSETSDEAIAGEHTVERGANTRRPRTRIRPVRALRRREQPVEQGGALVEIGVVVLEAGPVVMAHQREPDRPRVGHLEQVGSHVEQPLQDDGQSVTSVDSLVRPK